MDNAGFQYTEEEETQPGPQGLHVDNIPVQAAFPVPHCPNAQAPPGTDSKQRFAKGAEDKVSDTDDQSFEDLRLFTYAAAVPVTAVPATASLALPAQIWQGQSKR